MAITITLQDALGAGLQHRAERQQLSVEQLAISILSEAIEGDEAVAPREVAARIQALAPNPAQVRSATLNLADLLSAAPGDPSFDFETWRRQWSTVESELKAIARANDVAEGRAR